VPACFPCLGQALRPGGLISGGAAKIALFAAITIVTRRVPPATVKRFVGL
jgi:hypothetical protein